MLDRLRSLATGFGVWMASPFAFAVPIGYTLGWLYFGRDTFGWHAVAVLATLVMTLFIQRAVHRDTQAIHAKLDELLRAHRGARDELTKIDEREPEEIEVHRQKARRHG